MPIVITKSGGVQYVRSSEVLAEILGHTNFDDENWTIGDRIIFEDGTQSRIKQEPREQVFNWDDPTPADLEEVKVALRVADAADWRQLFKRFEAPSKQSLATRRRQITIIGIGLLVAAGIVVAALGI